MPDSSLEEIREYATVKQWIAETKVSTFQVRDEWPGKLSLLKAFCEYESVDPDTMIQRSKTEPTAKNDFMRDLKKWAGEMPGTERARHEAENTIRGFFMKNGFRVMIKPFTDVYKRS